MSFLDCLEARLVSGQLSWSWRGAALVLALLGIRYGEVLFGATMLIDEGTYLQAFEASGMGLSPYSIEGYLYTPAFAEAGSWLVAGLGPNRSRWLLRLLNISGLLTIAAYSVTWLTEIGARERFRQWVLVGSLLGISTGVRFGLVAANLSFLAGGLLVVALVLLDRKPWLAGSFLAASALVKPFAVPAIAVLAVAGIHARRRSWLTASGCAAVLGLAASLPSPHLRGMLVAQPSPLTEMRATSIGRLLGLVGLQPSALVLTILLVTILCGAAWLCARRPIAVLSLCLLGVMVMPVVWNHSLVVLTPLFFGALGLAWERREKSRKALLLVTLGGLAFLIGETGAIDMLPNFPQLVLLLPPLVAPILLATYLLQIGPEQGASEVTRSLDESRDS